MSSLFPDLITYLVVSKIKTKSSTTKGFSDQYILLLSISSNTLTKSLRSLNEESDFLILECQDSFLEVVSVFAVKTEELNALAQVFLISYNF